MAGQGFKDFTVGEVLTAADVDNYLMQQSVMRFADSSARGSALGTAVLAEGMTSYLDDVNRIEFYDGSAWQRPVVSSSAPSEGEILSYDSGSGTWGPQELPGVLQVQRSTASSLITYTTATGWVDTGLSVSITPQYASSAIYVFMTCQVSSDRASGGCFIQFRITDGGGTVLSGAEDGRVGHGGANDIRSSVMLIGRVAAGSTSARTYKRQAQSSSALYTGRIHDNDQTAQIIALEVAE